MHLKSLKNETILFLFSAGNAGRYGGSPNYSNYASSPRIISVGATRQDGTRASYSNFGAALWISAPAGDHEQNVTWTSYIKEGIQVCGEVGVGTSYSAPMVAGAATILKSVRYQIKYLR